jgi:hypothetical protein
MLNINDVVQSGLGAMRETFKLTERAFRASRGFKVEAVYGKSEATRRVRHEVYCLEKGYLTSDTIFDRYDQRATLLNVFDGSEPVGTMRIIDSADGRLELFDIYPELETLMPAGRRYAEFSRLMVIRRCRGLRATVPLFRRAALEIMARGVDGVILSCTEGLMTHYARVAGFRPLPVQTLAYERLRTEGYPMILELSEALENLTAARWPFWLAISPSVFARALGMMAARRLRGLIPAMRPGTSGSAP